VLGATTWLRCRVCPLVATAVPALRVGGCLREDDRVGRGGGGMSVFFGDGGRPGCRLTMSSCLTVDVGPRPSVLALVGIPPGLTDDGTLN
jgi:hypothetical protein